MWYLDRTGEGLSPFAPVLFVVAVLAAVILALPVQAETRNQLLTVFGLLVSGVIAPWMPRRLA